MKKLFFALSFAVLCLLSPKSLVLAADDKKNFTFEKLTDFEGDANLIE